MAQNSPFTDPASAIAAAGKSNDRLFTANMWAILVCGCVLALFTWWLRRSDGKLQALVQNDANLRIEEAKRGAEVARKEAEEARKETQVIRLAVAGANARAEEAKATAESYKAEIAKANEQAEMLKLKALELEKELKGVALSTALNTARSFNQAILMAEMQRVKQAGIDKVVIEHWQDSECRSVAKQIEASIVMGGGSVAMFPISESNNQGVAVWHRGGAAEQRACDIISLALENGGLFVEWNATAVTFKKILLERDQRPPDPGIVFIMVMLRPTPQRLELSKDDNAQARAAAKKRLSTP